MSVIVPVKGQGSWHSRDVSREEPRAAGASLDNTIRLDQSLYFDMHYARAMASWRMARLAEQTGGNATLRRSRESVIHTSRKAKYLYSPGICPEKSRETSEQYKIQVSSSSIAPAKRISPSKAHLLASTHQPSIYNTQHTLDSTITRRRHQQCCTRKQRKEHVHSKAS
jgi:hypothetical protein